MRLKNKICLNSLIVLLAFVLVTGCSVRQNELNELVVDKIKVSKTIFLDYERLAGERTVYITPLNLDVKEVDVKALEKILTGKDMQVVRDPQKAAYVLQLFIRELTKNKVTADVLVRERPILVTTKSGNKVYTTDLDSKDHMTTIEITVSEGGKEKLVEELFKQVAALFDVRR